MNEFNQYLAETKESEFAILSIEIFKSESNGGNRTINISLNEKSNSFEFLGNLENLCNIYYNTYLKTEKTYGFSYQITKK